MHRPRGDGVCSLPARQRLHQSCTVGAGAGSPRREAVPGLRASRTDGGQGCRNGQGSPSALGNGVKPARGTGGPAGGPQAGMEPRGPSQGGRAEPGLSTTFQDRHQQRGAQTQPGAAPSKQQLYSQHCSLAPLRRSPSPKTQPRDSLQSLDRLPVPHVSRFAVSQGTWVFFCPFWRR